MSAVPTCGWTLISGCVAGAGSTIVFTAIHHLFISDIWFSLPLMLVAGAACGLTIAWSYTRLFGPPAAASWVRYNLVFVGLLILLGLVSLVVFDPITTIPILLAANEPPNELIVKAMPLTLGFIGVSAALIHLRWGRNLLDGVAILVTCTVIILLLGLNVSILGLVYIPSTAAYLVAELFGLTLALNVVYLALFLRLVRWRSARRWAHVSIASGTGQPEPPAHALPVSPTDADA
jgi:hypothetical protein